MSYVINIEINGFTFQFGDMGYPSVGHGAFINFSDPSILEAIQNNNALFFEALRDLLSKGDELDALNTMEDFEHYYLQGHGWHTLIDNYGYKSQQNFERKAKLVLQSDLSDENQKITAQNIIDVLNGDYIRPPIPQKSPAEKAHISFVRKKPKLRTKLVIRDGYKCDNCGKDKEDSLCIIQKTQDELNYELENLTLRCRSCMNKMKKKK
jgi:hypothetical protein